MKNLIKRFIARDEKGRLFMNVVDKVPTDEILGKEKQRRYCPPHYLPHTLPLIGEKVKDEPCHFHTTDWRSSHHNPYCLHTRCPYAEDMLRAKDKYLADVKEESLTDRVTSCEISS